ncbi:hypothetical protein [Desulfoluna sp.]|uniref:hypothetical protein n=1 Tax=Desulfoluna sp. TaxID=2045199 RepID=UPI002629192C|nr:hypothetical protein [Desulfoluna sp.]
MPTALVALLFCSVVVLVILRLIYNPDDEITIPEEEMAPFHVVITPYELACEHAIRKREAVPWEEIHEIVLITAFEGPMIPSFWLIFVGEGKGCSIPTEAKGFQQLWDQIETRFPGFDVQAVLKPETDKAKKSVWRQAEVTH